MNDSNIDPALRAIDGAATPAAVQRMRSASHLSTGVSREGTPQVPPGRQAYYNNMQPAAAYYAPVPFLSQTQQIQKLFELNPSLQQLQNAANKATETIDDEEGEELDDEQLANSNAHSRENLQ
jgi:hypothetical protein